MNRVTQFLIYYLPVLLYIATIIFLSGQQADSPIIRNFPVPLKLGHFFGYAGLSFLIYRAINKTVFRWDFKFAILSLLLSVLYAMLDEWYQTFIPGRDGNVADVFLNAAGITFGLAAVWSLTRVKVLLCGK